MARHARRGRFALRLEVLEDRTLPSGSPSGISPSAPAQRQVQGRGLVPNDPLFGQQWALGTAGKAGTGTTRAWSDTTGSPDTIVAILDSGIDLANPEFAGRIWTNPDASGSDGYPGDVHGWNFVANDADVQDNDGHGTHVAGILAASGNNAIGVAGVDWNAQIMPLKVLDSSGNGNNDAIARAILFAVEHGARVINASWGGGPYSQAVADAISVADRQGVVFVTAAGNSGTNVDQSPFYPASYHLPNEVVVAAVDAAGNLAGFSNYGARSVSLAAPGVNILSTVPGGYAYESGTSMATPYVAGVAALVAGLHPTFTAEQVVQQLLSTVRPSAALVGKTEAGGILDAARAVGRVAPAANGADSAARAARPSPAGPGPGAPATEPASSHHHRRRARPTDRMATSGALPARLGLALTLTLTRADQTPRCSTAHAGCHRRLLPRSGCSPD
jgi:subtilisin family serine protease